MDCNLKQIMGVCTFLLSTFQGRLILKKGNRVYLCDLIIIIYNVTLNDIIEIS